MEIENIKCNFFSDAPVVDDDYCGSSEPPTLDTEKTIYNNFSDDSQYVSSMYTNDQIIVNYLSKRNKCFKKDVIDIINISSIEGIFIYKEYFKIETTCIGDTERSFIDYTNNYIVIKTSADYNLIKNIKTYSSSIHPCTDKKCSCQDFNIFGIYIEKDIIKIPINTNIEEKDFNYEYFLSMAQKDNLNNELQNINDSKDIKKRRKI